MNDPAQVITVLTVAGSDSSAGAGIQADLKTFAALGVFGCSAISAVTAQNSQGVLAVEAVSPKLIARQIEAVVSDYGTRVLKTGMLVSAAAVRAVAEAIDRYRFDQVVVDPVLVAGSGQALMDVDTREALLKLLIPRATLLTPNLPEAGSLLQQKVDGLKQAEIAARELNRRGAAAVVITGGHLAGQDLSCTDLLFDGRRFERFSGPRLETSRDHGTGCTFASAAAALLARGRSLSAAVRGAGDYVRAALEAAAKNPLGQGRGPLDHFPPSLPESLR